MRDVKWVVETAVEMVDLLEFCSDGKTVAS